MRKLVLPPDRSSYLPAWAANGRMTEDDAAPAPLFAGGPDGGVQVSVVWICDEQEYAYLQAFMRLLGEGARPFLLDLVVDTVEPTEYVCSLVGGSLSLSSVDGPLRTVSADLVAIREDRRAWREFNAATFALLGGPNPGFALAMTTLDELVTDVLPEELGG